MNTLYEGKTYSYGISFLGPVLWCFGLPAGSSYLKLDLRLYLKKKSTDEIIWSYNIDKSKTDIQGLYYGKDIKTYINLLSDALKPALTDLKLKLSQIPYEKLKDKQLQPQPPQPVQEPAAQLQPEFSISAIGISAAAITAK